ncbi:hypothetical protein ACP70R_020770 [Stipagrostis hirtigluma subsp. patula]
MIRNAASVLRRSPVACLRRSAAVEQRRLVSHPWAASSPSRGFHGSGPPLPMHAAPPPSMSPAAAVVNRRLSTAKRSTVAEKKAELARQLFEKEAAIAAARDREKRITQDEQDRKQEELLACVKGKKRRETTEELLSLVAEQAASGMEKDHEALLLARSARAADDIDKLKEQVRVFKYGNRLMLACIGVLAYIDYHCYCVYKLLTSG